MNASHSRLTDWGLKHISINADHTILDVGCGGGRTVSTLAAAAPNGRVYGVDYSEESVAVSTKTNLSAIDGGRVQIHRASAAELPFSDGVLDLVTAVETHFWWSDLPGGMREILRVLKPSGQLVVIAEVYKGANTRVSRLAQKYAERTGMTLLSADEHRQLLADTGYSDVQIIEEGSRGWICGMGRRPSIPRDLVPHHDS
jgi:ubiquinone/menaquinone biosynthesis C-methylase UbiE